MSIKPYNNLTVRDLSNVEQPYVNSTTEFGYFRGGSLGTIANGLWQSLPTTLKTNNGIANVDASGGLILQPGIYKINISLFPTTTQDGSSNISFNFGTRYLSNISTSSSATAFGGPCSTGMFTYDPFNNPYSPGIISWVADGYNSGTNTISNFVKNPTTNELSYNYYNSGYSDGTLYGGNCTTEITFVIDSSETIYFNVSTSSVTGVIMGNSFFTLEFISSNTIINNLTVNWTKGINAPNSAFYKIATSSTGQYVFAAGFSNGIYRSINYGVNWNRLNSPVTVPALNWYSISSSSSGQYLAAGTYDNIIYYSSNYGVNWYPSSGSPSTQWISIASSSTGQYMVAVGNNGSIYRSTTYGESWGVGALPTALVFSCISSSSTGQYMAAGRVNNFIYVSDNYGSSWGQKTTSASKIWGCITTSSTGQYMAAGVGTISGNSTGYIYISSNYGNTWNPSTSSTIKNWAGITSSSSGQYLAAVTSNSTIYISSNYGVTWKESINKLVTLSYYSVSSSSNGQYIYAGTSTNGIYWGVYP